MFNEILIKLSLLLTAVVCYPTLLTNVQGQGFRGAFYKGSQKMEATLKRKHPPLVHIMGVTISVRARSQSGAHASYAAQLASELERYAPGDMENPDGHFEEFFLKRSSKLSLLFEQYSAKPDRSVFISQPEILMILDLLEKDEYTLAENWSQAFPLEELEKVALFWGKSLNLEA